MSNSCGFGVRQRSNRVREEGLRRTLIDMQTATARRPVPVIVVGCLYVVVGIGGAAAHLMAMRRFESDVLPAVVVNLAALISGIWILRRQNWARWLAIAWMAFHVILSVFHSPREL